jgi:putative membrane protein
MAALLSNSDAQRIETVIAEIERRSAAEFVVAVVPRCARYDRGRALVAATWAVAAAVLYFRFLPWGKETIGLLLELPVFVIIWLVLGVPSIHRFLIPARHADDAVHGAAFRMFAEKGIHRTKGRTGILLLVSELERRAVLLGDSGIHDKVGDEGWPRLVEQLLSRIREGRVADGIVEVLQKLEERLAENVPVESDDVDELSNEVLR